MKSILKCVNAEKTAICFGTIVQINEFKLSPLFWYARLSIYYELNFTSKSVRKKSSSFTLQNIPLTREVRKYYFTYYTETW